MTHKKVLWLIIDVWSTLKKCICTQNSSHYFSVLWFLDTKLFKKLILINSPLYNIESEKQYLKATIR